MNEGLRAITFIALVLIGSCSWSWARGDRPDSDTATAIPVVAARVTRGTIHRQLATSGELLPYQAVDVHPKTGGQITSISVREGSIVVKGAVLAVLDHRIPDSQVELAEAAVAVAHVAVEMADVAVESSRSALAAAQAQAAAVRAQATNLAESRRRLENLHREGAVARQQLDDAVARHDEIVARQAAAEAAVSQAETGVNSSLMNSKMKRANLEQAKANLNVATVQREDYFVTAPFAGVITRRHVDPGAQANPAQPILRLEQVDPIKAVCTVSERHLTELHHEGIVANIRLDSHPEVIHGSIHRIHPAVERSTRTGRFDVLVDNPDGRLRSGSFATVQLNLETVDNAVIVPRDALLTHRGERFALRITSDDVVERIPVQLGIHQDRMVEIVDGLDEGDIIVTRGIEFVRAGVPVSVVMDEERP